ncbi:MAG: hypothetical protein GY809_15745 [Planctomycetes bacterium]|nr:hypothetical protein [Planctomycetota bacterium]
MSDGQDLHLDSDQRTRLLRIGLSASSSKDYDVEPDENRTDTLYQILTSTLPLSQDIKASMPDLITGQAQDLVSISGEPIGKLIQDQKTDLISLRKVKDHCKQNGAATDSKEEQDAFMAAYFAAIASAMLFHDTRISHHKDEDLCRFFFSFSQKPWVLEELRAIFVRASLLNRGNATPETDT